jgi:hypothetical protein
MTLASSPKAKAKAKSGVKMKPTPDDELPVAPMEPAWSDEKLEVPFPAVWPPDGGRRVLYYVFSRALDPSLADAERIGSVSGYWTEASDGTRATFTKLAGAVVELGIQGVQALGPADAKILDRREVVGQRLKEMMGRSSLPDEGSPEAAEVRKFYCAWRRLNGVLAGALAKRQAPFFRWLKCDPR